MSMVYISEQGVNIHKTGGRFEIRRNKETVLTIPQEIIEGFVILNHVQVSSEAITELLKLNIPVSWISARGEFFGRLASTRDVNVYKHKQQFIMQETKWALAMSRKNIRAKLNNQRVILRRYLRNQQENACIEKVKDIIQEIQWLEGETVKAETIEQLMGYEGLAARYYFEALGLMLPDTFSFAHRTRQPPLDPFNSMLSLGYTMLLYEIYTALLNQGLHPYVGFTHSLQNHHPALASDLLEQWRSLLIDAMAMSLVHHHEILPEHFSHSEKNDGIYLTREGRNIFIRAYEKKLRAMNKYQQGEHSYRKSLELQAAAYSHALMEADEELYETLCVR